MREDELLTVILDMGRAMIVNGAEVWRVEEILNGICDAYAVLGALISDYGLFLSRFRELILICFSICMASFLWTFSFMLYVRGSAGINDMLSSITIYSSPGYTDL